MRLAAAIPTAALIGAIFGFCSQCSLRTRNYRSIDEEGPSRPRSTGWVVPVAVVSTSVLSTRLAPHHPWQFLVLLPLTAGGPWLAAVDLDVHRLPDRALGPIAVLSLLAVAGASLGTRDVGFPLLAVAGTLLTGGSFWLLCLLSGGALGLGDVKLAALIGLAVGTLGLGVLWWALLLPSLMCLVWFLVAHRETPRGVRIAFGPWMLLGALVAVVVLGG